MDFIQFLTHSNVSLLSLALPATCFQSPFSFLHQFPIFMTDNLSWLPSISWCSITHLSCTSSQFLIAALTLQLNKDAQDEWGWWAFSPSKPLVDCKATLSFLTNSSVRPANFHSSFMPPFFSLLSILLLLFFNCWEISSLQLPSVCPHWMQSSHSHYHL